MENGDGVMRSKTRRETQTGSSCDWQRQLGQSRRYTVSYIASLYTCTSAIKLEMSFSWLKLHGPYETC